MKVRRPPERPWDAGKRIDQRRLYRNLKAEWINKNFQWQEGKNGWQFNGYGLKSAALPVATAQER